jgi:hypothetical protein
MVSGRMNSIVRINWLVGLVLIIGSCKCSPLYQVHEKPTEFHRAYKINDSLIANFNRNTTAGGAESCTIPNLIVYGSDQIVHFDSCRAAVVSIQNDSLVFGGFYMPGINGGYWVLYYGAVNFRDLGLVEDYIDELVGYRK